MVYGYPKMLPTLQQFTCLISADSLDSPLVLASLLVRVGPVTVEVQFPAGLHPHRPHRRAASEQSHRCELDVVFPLLKLC